MKVLTVVGARPQFIKCAPLSRQLRKVADEVLLHTGQHYDYLMSEVFFEDLGIPKPEYHLEIGSGPHGKQTGLMMAGIEGVIEEEAPDCLLVFGDTNSTLAAALAAAKLHVPVAHVEAGLRSGNKRMPEEINRILTDHVSDLLFCPTPSAVASLESEGITEGVSMTGDVMHEVLMGAVDSGVEAASKATAGFSEYALATIHRAENTDSLERLKGILTGLRDLSRDLPVVWPLHPRVRAIMDRDPGLETLLGDRVRLVDPLPYPATAGVLSRARVLVTDSGGMQKEAFWLGVPCVTARDETEWVETVEAGGTVLVGADAAQLVSEALASVPRSPVEAPDPLPSALIVDQLVTRFSA